jgi:hypothetical protein
MNGAANNVAVGKSALTAITTGAYNVAIGSVALDALLSTNNNVAIGFSAMGLSTVGANCTFVGANAGADGVITAAADGSVGIGSLSLLNLTSGAGNVAVGYQAGQALTASNFNTLVGHQAGVALPSGAHTNTAIGYQSLTAGNNATTDHNTCVGYTSGDVITTGTQNTIIGSGSDPSAVGATNQTVIGYDITGVADNSVTLGNANVTDVYMAQDSGAIVHTAGIQFPATQAANAGANVLDDYEEGSYTPAISESGGQTPTAASGSSKLSYTKIGRLVNVMGTIQIDNIDSGSGSLRIALPFTPKATDAGTGYHASYVGTYSVDVLGDGEAIFAQVDPSTAYVSLVAFRDNASSVDQIATGYYRFQIQFEV